MRNEAEMVVDSEGFYWLGTTDEKGDHHWSCCGALESRGVREWCAERNIPIFEQRRWSIYHRDCEYAREVGDPELGIVTATSQEEAEAKALARGIIGPTGIIASTNVRRGLVRESPVSSDDWPIRPEDKGLAGTGCEVPVEPAVVSRVSHIATLKAKAGLTIEKG